MIKFKKILVGQCVFLGYVCGIFSIVLFEVANNQIHISYKMDIDIDILDKQKLPISAVARLDILGNL